MKVNRLFVLVFTMALVSQWVHSTTRADDLTPLAKKEGKLVVYSTFPGSALSDLLNTFEKKYGIKTEFFRESSTAVIQKYLAEVEASDVRVDVVQPSDLPPMIDMGKRGLLLPYISSEFNKLDQKFFDSKGLWFIPVLNAQNLIYNKKYVKGEEAPKKWEEMLLKKWDKRIVVGNPIAGGTSYVWYYTMRKLYGKQFHERLSGLKPKILVATAGMQQAVLAGESYLCGEMLQYLPWDLLRKNPEAPLGVAWPSPTPIAVRTSGITTKAPHPHAAKLYHDFLASEEGQSIIAVKYGSISPRGIKTPGLPSLTELHYSFIGPEEMDDFIKMRESYNREFETLYMKK